MSEANSDLLGLVGAESLSPKAKVSATAAGNPQTQLIEAEPGKPVKLQAQMIQALFEPDPEETAFALTVSADTRERIVRRTKRLRHGLHALAPLTCRGPQVCPFISHCPIPTRSEKLSGDYGPESDYPLALPCVLEQTFQQQRIIDYLERLEVDINDPIEMSVVNELSIIDLHKNRALMVLSAGDRDKQGQDFLRQESLWIQAGDSVVEQKSTTLHPAFDVLERLEKRRERLHDRLIATRKGRAEMDIKRGVAAEDSNLLLELQAVRKALGNLSGKTEEEPESLLLSD